MKFSKYSTGFYIACIFLLGAFLRLYKINSHTLYLDEFYVWDMSVHSLDYIVSSYWAQQSPLFFIIYKTSVCLFGDSGFALRLPSVVADLGAMILAYFLGKGIGGQRVGLVACFFYSVFYPYVSYAQAARPYAPGMLFSTLSTFFYIKILNGKRTVHLVPYSFFTALVFYMQYIFVFIVSFQILYFYYYRLRNRLGVKGTSYFIYCQLAILLLCLPGTPHLLSLFLRKGMYDWVHTTTLSTFWAYPSYLVLIWTISAILLFPFYGIYKISLSITKADRERIEFLALWYFLPNVIIYLVGKLGLYNMFWPRYTFTYSLPVLVLAAMGVKVLAGGKARRLFIIAVIAVAGLKSSSFYGQGYFGVNFRDAWGSAVGFIKENAEPNDVLIYRSGLVEADLLQTDHHHSLEHYLNLPIAYYLRNNTLRIINLPYSNSIEASRRYEEKMLSAIRSAKKFWLLTTPDYATDHFERWATRQGFKKMQEKLFGRSSLNFRPKLVALYEAQA